MKKISPVLILLIIALCSQSTLAQDKSFRERIREKVKARMIKREEEKPAPQTSSATGDKITKAGDFTMSLTHNNLLRFYKVHIPKNYNPETPTPLLVAFHGGGGDMNYQSNDKFYKQITKSEEKGYIVAFPNGISRFKSGKLATWNAGKCCGEARDTKADDVGFIKEMIAKISSQTNIDKNKIFATGMSNGGMMSYRLACEMSETFKGIAAVAGTDNTIDCAPKNPISVLHIHAKNDDHVLYQGGAGSGSSKNKSQVTDYVSVPATISKWVKFNGCSETPKRVLEVPGAYCDLYSSCKNNVEVKLCVTETGGHSWPGGVKPRGDDKTSHAISANDVMWDFFQTK